MINKKTKLKIMAQLLLCTGILGMDYGYEFMNNGIIVANAQYNTPNTSININNNIQNIYSSFANTFLVRKDGTVWGMGSNGGGVLGIGNTTNQLSPVKIPITDVKEFVSGQGDAFYLKNDGTLWATGANTYGQLGTGNTVNQLVPVKIAITNVSKIRAGGQFTFVMKNDGTVWATGYNAYGQLGTGNITNKSSFTQVPITNVKDIICSGTHTIFIKNDGTIWACGYNYYGELGVGDKVDKTSPVQIPITNVNKIFVGDGNTFFLKNDGTIWGCGMYSNTGLTGYSSPPSSPVQLAISNVKDITGGAFHLVVLKNDGTVWATGTNEYGQLGVGNTTNNFSYVQVPITNVVDIDSGGYHTTFVKDDGTIWTCGMNTLGQLGIGNTTNKLSPVQIPLSLLPSDTTAPTLTLTPSTTSSTNQNITITATATDDVGVASIIKPDNTVVSDSSTTYTISTNGTYIFKATDTSGNITTQTITVSNIDKTAPVITLGSYSTEMTNNPITVTATTNEGTLNTTSHVFTENGSFNFIATDSAGNNTTKTVTVSNIDKTAITALTKAEGSKLQADVNSARTLVNTLPSGNYKTDLTNRLDTVQTYINNVTDATTKVANTENNKTQANVDLAQTAINLLPTGDTNRTVLQNRLDVVKNYMVYQNQLSQATSAVTKAEGSKLQADVNSARTLVSALPTGTDKTSLTNRLDVVQSAIDKAKQDAQLLADAQAKVTTAETTKTQADIDVAQTAINKLADSTDKTNLQSRLDKVKSDLVLNDTKLTEATNAVVKAEGSKTQSDVDSAKTLVNALPDSTSKTDLINRLDVVQSAIDKAKQDTQLLADAQAKVTTAETTKTQADIDVAQTAINKLADGTDKTNLQSRLDKVKSDLALNEDKLTEATNAVVKAEGSKIQSDVDSARTLVNALPDSSTKTDLINRLDVVQSAIDAQKLKDAQTAVTVADTTKSTTDVTKAQTTINTLPSGDDKTALQNELDKIKQAIADKAKQDAYNNQLAQATALVTTAEGTKDTYDITKAQGAVSSLPSGTDKDTLQARLDALKVQVVKETQIKADLKDVTLKVQIAEASVNLSTVKTYIANAQTAIDKLPSCAEKTALQDRLNNVTVQIYVNANKSLAMQAEPLVKFAELYKTTSYKNKAWVVVNKMTDSDAKTKFVNRLNVIK